MTSPTGTPACFWRYGTAYVAWFCDADDARRWLEGGEEVYSAWDVSYLSAVGHEPQPGVTYEDLGHGHCLADGCPEATTGESANGGFRVGEDPWTTHWRWIAVANGVVLSDLRKMHQRETKGGVPTGKCRCGLPAPCPTAECVGKHTAALAEPCGCLTGVGNACPAGSGPG